MRVVALLAVRNEELYLERCLEHLRGEGVETCLIDNDSTDRTLEIARDFASRGVFRVEHLPFAGSFELERQLALKERLADEIAADWFIHHDADEVREAPPGYSGLVEGLEAADRAGYTAVDFDEFVFVPEEGASYEGRDYVAGMRQYYYYEPESDDRFRVNAWKKTPGADLRTHAGHRVVIPGLRVSPERFVLRHYIVLSRSHAERKYGGRRFAEAELEREWHADRAAFSIDDVRIPPPSRLKRLGEDGRFDTSDPWQVHPFFPAPSARRTEARRGEAAGDPSARARLRRFRREQGAHVPLIEPVAAVEPRPYWSVTIPTYNGRRPFLAEAIASVLAQDPGPGEMQIEVVDDGTTGYDVEALVREAGRGRVAFVRNARNLGLAGNWNECLRRSRGIWVHLLHQDDYVLPGFYERLRAACERRPDIGAAYCRCVGMGERGEELWRSAHDAATAGVLEDFAALESETNRVHAPSVVVRRSVYEEIGGYHEGLPYCADWDMYKRVGVHSPVWYEPEPLAVYRVHGASETSRLRRLGTDLADHARSVELARSYLPPELAERSFAVSLKTAAGWAARVLQESLAAGDVEKAHAQAREIAATLELLLSDGHSAARSVPRSAAEVPSEVERLWARVEWLEAQVAAWALAAEEVHSRHTRERREAGSGPVRT